MGTRAEIEPWVTGLKGAEIMAGWMSRMRLSAGVLGLWMLALAPPAQAQVDPYEIIDRVDELYRGESSHGTSTMEVVTENWTRQMTMELWSLGNDYSLVRIQAPAREAGTATLKADRDIYNYLPKVDRTIKIPTSMMGGSWMGSHFTNDDLVQESRLVDDYDITLSFSGDRNGEVVWEFTLVPKAEAAVVWGQIDYRVRQADYMPLAVSYYDEDGALARSMDFSDFATVGGRTIPRLMMMRPADKPDEYTSMRYDDLEFDVDLDASFFSLRTLQRRR